MLDSAKSAWFPPEASTTAAHVDLLLYFLLAVCGSVGLLVAFLMIYFCIRYRRRPGAGRPARTHASHALEWFWTIVPFFIFMGIFVWGAVVYVDAYHAPPDSIPVYGIGKQWMWKFQHPEGQREINTLHVPLGRPVQVLLTSEDVIHSFFIPAFRVHMDVLPNRYTSVWFEATKPGEYHLFCSQYCGTNHAGMIGTVVVMEQADFESWLSLHAEGSLALEGRKVHQLSQRHGRRAGSGPRGAVRKHREAEQRPLRRRGRRVHSRIDPGSGREDRCRLGKHYADVPRPDQRGGNLRPDFLLPFIAAGRDAAPRRRVSAADVDAPDQHHRTGQQRDRGQIDRAERALTEPP
jgi:cytochrome c oxidase subunit II